MRRGWLALIAAAVLLAACGGEAGHRSEGSLQEPAGIAPVPRPRDLRLDGVDPCSVLTPDQRTELGLDRPARRVPGSTQMYGPDNALCVISGTEPRSIVVGILLVTTVGIERWTHGELDSEIRPTQVEGFPALVAVPRRHTDFCTAVVDAAPGQLIDVHFRTGGRLPPIPQPQLCRDAEQVAGHVVRTLLVR